MSKLRFEKTKLTIEDLNEIERTEDSTELGNLCANLRESWTSIEALRAMNQEASTALEASRSAKVQSAAMIMKLSLRLAHWMSRAIEAEALRDSLSERIKSLEK